ncbi:MAG: UTP--glucose-1-phosphate uridylyltransferase, partial [Nitrospirae bacterium]|nr:UTP--glucose-1-phosphate uridylyltransferase [Nitrospirota bacterium]
MSTLIETIVSEDNALRHRSIDILLKNINRDDLLKYSAELEAFRKLSSNLYFKVRASLFLFVICRFHLQKNIDVNPRGNIPFNAVKAAFERDFERSIEIYWNEITGNGNQNSAIFSAMAESYHYLSFDYLLDQVKLSISRRSENFYLYNISGLDDYPYSVPPELITPDPVTGWNPIGMDAAPVRLDPSHSGWSDIFFLGMDFPEGARVINISVNLRINGSKDPIKPPCECYSRFIDEPVIHLTSVDLKRSKKISTIKELFNLGNDHLSLLKAGVIASGIVPPCFEHKDILLKDILHKLLNRRGGIEIVTQVNGLPKGSRLAVSTMLLSTIITRLMRFSNQIKNQTGPLKEDERRIVSSRAILGEWLGGSGGGWQDSGGLWPGIKVIKGKRAEKGDPEFGISRGCLLPEHKVFSGEEISNEAEEKIVNSIVLVHGGMSQDVGPVLELVTEKYLLKYEKEWAARKKGILLFDKIVHSIRTGDMKELGRLTTQDWEDSTQQIIPRSNNAFTEDLIGRLKQEFTDDYWGFLMLGGMSGGGMAFIVNPQVKKIFKERIANIMKELKDLYRSSYPFIMDPLVYDFEINHAGISASLLTGKDAVMPEIGAGDKFPSETSLADHDEKVIKEKYGFNARSHEHMKSMLKTGEIGLAKNRMPLSTKIQDVNVDDIFQFEKEKNPPLPPFVKGWEGGFYNIGMDALKRKEIAVVTLAGGLGSRWSQGSPTVKAINPFICMEGKYRTFLEIHLAKSRKSGELCGRQLQHVFTTSYLTHKAIEDYLKMFHNSGYKGSIYLSASRSIGRRVYPMERDLRFFWDEQPHQKSDENTQHVLESSREALIDWTISRGEGDDYSESEPMLRFNPPGHWHEIPNMMKNSVLAKMLIENPNLKYLLCHNIDTLGAYVEPSLLGMHIANQSCLTFEVIPRRIDDRGGGLAKVNGHIQLIEGLALPREEDEYMLSYYNTLTNWITIDHLLEFFGLDREMIIGAEGNHHLKEKISDAIHNIEISIPAYVTIKNVKYLWGKGQEDVYP